MPKIERKVINLFSVETAERFVRKGKEELAGRVLRNLDISERVFLNSLPLLALLTLTLSVHRGEGKRKNWRPPVEQRLKPDLWVVPESNIILGEN